MRHQNPQQVEAERTAAAERARVAAELEVSDIKWLMGSERGRRIVWRALTRAKVFTTSFSTVALEMAQAEGRKAEGYHLLGLVHAAAPNLYPTMVAENTK